MSLPSTTPPTMHSRNKTSFLLALPKELVFQIITLAAISNDDLYPRTLIELSQCNSELHYFIHRDPFRLKTLWPQAFHERFDTNAIYRRRLHGWDWQKIMELRCKALYACKAFADQPGCTVLLDNIRWDLIWDMITEHDDRNISHILNYKVHVAAVAAYRLDQYRGRQLYPVVLPILSLLVNYDFSITSHFRAPTVPDSAQIVSPELSQFAYSFEAADSLITKHAPSQPLRTPSQPNINVASPVDKLTRTFYPALDASAAALHLFFATFFASHPSLYSAIPGCVPIPLFQINSSMFDVEYLRRYERNLFSNSHYRNGDHSTSQHTCVENVTALPSTNIYLDTGFASPYHFVSEAHHIAGEWLGYYSFVDPEDSTTHGVEDWFDGPMRLSIWIVPLYDVNSNSISNTNNTSSILISTSSSTAVATVPLTMTISSAPPALLTLASSSASSVSGSSPTISLAALSTLSSPPALHLSALSTSLTTPWSSRWASVNNNGATLQKKSRQHNENGPQFPQKHLKACPLTKFEGSGVDNLGSFTVVGLIDDTEDGQVTWEKTYVETGEAWEYSGKFTLPMGICGRWGDEEYGGPWWIWKTSDGASADPASPSSLAIK